MSSAKYRRRYLAMLDDLLDAYEAGAAAEWRGVARERASLLRRVDAATSRKLAHRDGRRMCRGWYHGASAAWFCTLEHGHAGPCDGHGTRREDA